MIGMILQASSSRGLGEDGGRHCSLWTSSTNESWVERLLREIELWYQVDLFVHFISMLCRPLYVSLLPSLVLLISMTRPISGCG